MRIEVKDLTHIYSEGMPFETVALQDVSFTVEPGTFVGLIGHTGSGKSTLIQHLNGLLKPMSGKVLADGVDVTEKSDISRSLRRKIGLVFQYPEYQLFEETVLKDVCFGPKNLGLSQEICEERAMHALRLVGLDAEDVRDRSPFGLSGGEKRRVAIAGVLAMDPEVLILDEPTAGLDPKGHNDILNMIQSIRQARDLTIILVSHNMDDVARLADRVLVMENGTLVMEGPPRSIFIREEQLRQLGLSLPSATVLMQLLAGKGYPVRTDVLTAAEAEEEIIRVFG
ncbi:MAG: energy-coupling factor transporter ATPase [Bacillota bacterium]|jgi:energy-coupling factor transport system ATP-binding protein|nr:energy-coupling factor transporter ATPase [Eubacteriales bacterium]MDI9491903.1 energy-coupling factor transporter ATPase [Bacillota bacterium]NLV70838.1 energy-coupling factor transporter ATPase [Clostridiales bacterium]HRV33972.1 energy-coupling factor transporter ATPase [Anaerovoracaceae bacterium]MDD4285629.1 energy-coupling factor transporter ATPase [Eubacteriales bacterium]